jgi:predicted AAA+ superfamily ATPase
MNFKIPKSIIPKEHYLNAVEPFIDKGVIKVFTGQRRVGKSYLLYQIIQKVNTFDKSNIIYINKEDLAFSSIKTAEDLNDYILKNKK